MKSDAFLSRRVIFYQVLGFIGAILIIWIDEYYDLPRILFQAAPSPFNWKEAVFESSLVLILAVLTVVATRSLFAKIEQQQEILSACCSCKKIKDDDGQWQYVESFIEEKAHIRFTHGICPECARKLYPDIDFDAPENSQS